MTRISIFTLTALIASSSACLKKTEIGFAEAVLAACRTDNSSGLKSVSWTDFNEMKAAFGDKAVFDRDRVQKFQTALEEEIEIFQRSYRDLCDGELAVVMSAPVDTYKQEPWAEKMKPSFYVIWVQKDGRYHGIVIDNVVDTARGPEVMGWIGNVTAGMGELRKKRANLVVDDIESCHIPSAIVYESEHTMDSRGFVSPPGYAGAGYGGGFR